MNSGKCQIKLFWSVNNSYYLQPFFFSKIAILHYFKIIEIKSSFWEGHLTLSICSLQFLHLLRLDFAYSTNRSSETPFSRASAEGAPLPPPPPPSVFAFTFSWSSQRRESNPSMSVKFFTFSFLKKQLKWNQFGIWRQEGDMMQGVKIKYLNQLLIM